MSNLNIDLCIFTGREDNKPNQSPGALSWDNVVDKLFSKHDERVDKDGPLFSPVRYKPCTTRGNKNIDHISAIVIDYDGDVAWQDVQPLLKGLTYASYSTHSNSEDKPCFRVVIPFDKSVSPTDWPEVWARCHARFGGDPVDKDPARIYYLASHAPGNPFWTDRADGEPLDPYSLPKVEYAATQEYRRVDLDFVFTGIPAGQRYMTLFKYACRLRAKNYAWQEATACMEKAASQCIPPYPESKDRDDIGWNTILTDVWDRYSPGSEEVIKLANGVTQDELNELIELNKQPEPAPRKYTIDGLIPEGCVSSIFGQGDVSKSYLALFIAESIRLGLPVFRHATKPCRVWYLDAELDQEEMTRRAYSIARGLGLDKPPEGVFYDRIKGNLLGQIENIRSKAEANDVELIIVDSLTIALMDSDVNSHAAMIPAIKQIETLGTVIVIDHTAKVQPTPGFNASLMTQFGSVFKRNLVRSSIKLEKHGDGTVTMKHDKHNFGQKASDLTYKISVIDGPPQVFKFELVELPTELQSIIGALDGGSDSVDNLIQNLGLSFQEVNKWLADGKSRGLLKSNDDGTWDLIRKQSESSNDILSVMRELGRPITAGDYAVARGVPIENVYVRLSRATKAGQIFKLERGTYWFDKKDPTVDTDVQEAMNVIKSSKEFI